jgi:hypothetical protein
MKLSGIEVEGLGQRCKEARKRYCDRTGTKAFEIALKLGIRREYLYKLESDDKRRTFRVDLIYQLEELYNEKLLIPPSCSKAPPID